MSINKNSIIDFPTDYTVIDIETTGFSPTYDSIIELAAIKYRDDNIVDSYTTLINPEIPIADEISSLTGISDFDVNDKPIISEVINEFISFIGDDLIVGHNVGFDINFINVNLKQPISNKYINTLRIAHKLHPELTSYSLDELKQIYGVESISHRALGDCEGTALVFQKMKKDVLSKMTLDEFQKLYNQKSKGYGFKLEDIKTDNTEFDEDNFFYGKSTCFTGKLEKYTRKEALQIIVDLGGIAANSVTASTNVLVIADLDYTGAITGRISSKHKKALDLRQKGKDIIVISESDFINLIEQ